MRGGADRVRVADRLNVAERLAEGRPAAEHTQSYVRACHLVGYQHPDLTAYPAQIHDWYGSEDGLDLHALDADCAQLRAAASVLMEALRMERSQVAVLAAAWTGSEADAAVHFVQRHCETGNSVVTEVRAAAQRCESLRDNLWQLVDSKVATAIAIDERALAQRPAWLAAAEALTTEGADRPTAVEVVRQQIQPYVDDDVRNDWLTTMRSTTAGVAASYDAVTDQLASAPRAHFEIPDDLGPGRQPSPASVPAQPSATAAITPAAALPPPDPVPAVTSRPVTPSDFGSAPGDGSATPAGVGSAGGFGDAAAPAVWAGLPGLPGLPTGSSMRWIACWVRWPNSWGIRWQLTIRRVPSIRSLKTRPTTLMTATMPTRKRPTRQRSRRKQQSPTKQTRSTTPTNRCPLNVPRMSPRRPRCRRSPNRRRLPRLRSPNHRLRSLRRAAGCAGTGEWAFAGSAVRGSHPL